MREETAARWAGWIQLMRAHPYVSLALACLAAAFMTDQTAGALLTPEGLMLGAAVIVAGALLCWRRAGHRLEARLKTAAAAAGAALALALAALLGRSANAAAWFTLIALLALGAIAACLAVRRRLTWRRAFCWRRVLCCGWAMCCTRISRPGSMTWPGWERVPGIWGILSILCSTAVCRISTPAAIGSFTIRPFIISCRRRYTAPWPGLAWRRRASGKACSL